MSLDEIEKEISRIRATPLSLVCITPSGQRKIMGVRECLVSGSMFVHVDCTELDVVLGIALGGDADAIAENRRKS